MTDALVEEFAALEAAMAPLEPDGPARARLAALMEAHAAAFLEALPRAPASRPRGEVFARPLTPEFLEAPRAADEVLAHVRYCVDAPGITSASPRFMGYIPGGGLFHAAVGAFLAAVSNKYAGFASAAPGAVRLENAVVAWLAREIGYPEAAGGTLTSGGSVASLTAVVAARDAHDPAGGGAVYLTRFAHHCIAKALHVAGRGGAPRRLIETDERGRMRPDALEAALARDAAAGVRPWLVVASAGTVDTGAVDPLDEIATIAARHGAWLHVDGAYGGLLMLCEEGRAALGGIERADSVALDPHKALFLPYGVGAVLVRDGRRLTHAFSASADYIRPFSETDVGPSPADLSVELTRPFRALGLWLPLQLAGLGAFRAAQSEKIRLARHFHARLSDLPGFEAGPPPDLSVVAFRYLPRNGDTDAFNEALIARVQEEGEVFISGTRIDGRAFLRAAILSFRTHLADVEALLAALARGVAALEREGRGGGATG